MGIVASARRPAVGFGGGAKQIRIGRTANWALVSLRTEQDSGRNPGVVDRWLKMIRVPNERVLLGGTT